MKKTFTLLLSSPFSLSTIPNEGSGNNFELAQKVISFSREHYSTPRSQVEEILAKSMNLQFNETTGKIIDQPKQTPQQIELIKVFEPETFFNYLDSLQLSEQVNETESTFKGYRVKVNYDSLTKGR